VNFGREKLFLGAKTGILAEFQDVGHCETVQSLSGFSISQAFELGILPVWMEAGVEWFEAIVPDGPITDLKDGPLMLKDD
jgi:hypothetical protein